MINFSDWLTQQYETMTAIYRRALANEVAAFNRIMAGHHIKVSDKKLLIKALKSVKMPIIQKYPGNATEEDKKYFTAAKKPDFEFILNDLIRNL